ncbi:malic enzyme [Cardiosporidium cionae]|uniref:Survival of motor neuron-related-splicing factor 30 n=1 Tax=Cardiosporidium cionae TaxID=476202 RepID=A0ABQ7J8J4_9APIC|nr:malic enzyme [Cardiosporidium cionae]|eukprot:KAF8820307.1 malic enzyme [Cardiosporidium cionae]
MADFEESTEELQARLSQYKEQLMAVEAAILENHEEDSLFKLEADLKEVIVLTEDLIRFKLANESSHADLLHTNAQLLLDTKTEEEYDLSFKEESQDTSSLPPSSLHISSTKSTAADARAAKLAALTGRTCQTPCQGKLVYGEIMGVAPPDAARGECLIVKFIGWEHQEACSTHQIRLLPSLSAHYCVPGTKLQGLYSEDGKWYDCQIDECTLKGCKVTFSGYGNTEELKFDRIRFPVDHTKEAKSNKAKEILTPGGYRIPEYLTIKATDSETQKLSKKKRIQLLKKKQRTEQMNEAAQVRATSWRKFNTKASTKKVSGYLIGRGYQSIFKSEDQPPPAPSLSSIIAPKSQSFAFIPRRKHDSEEYSTPS